MNVIDIFKAISKIPRETGHEEKIAGYLYEFAKKRNLECYKDKYNNVIIKKKTCKGKPLILQAHTDMVCEKVQNKEFNFEKDQIEVIEKDGYLMANGTTLGADNGIGVAQILYILDSNIEGNVEAVFTTSEETTMQGSIGLDTSMLEGNILLNLDGFEEDTILLESAAFHDIIMKLKYNKEILSNTNLYNITLSGLEGGHSGFDIDKNRGNSSIILSEILQEVDNIQILDFIGGTKFNVIPSEASCIFATNLNEEKLQKTINEKLKEINRKNVKIELTKVVKEISSKEKYALDITDSKKFLNSVTNFPNGVINKNEQNEVTTSVNLGVVSLKENVFKIGMRSSRKIEDEKTVTMLKEYAKENNMEFEEIGYQPGFQTDRNDDIVKLLEKAFYLVEENKNRKLSKKAVHITVEVGIIKEKMPELQVAIISPNIQGAHTVNEKVEIASIERTTKWIEEFIKLYNRIA